jgi:hypothetical protein
MSDAPKPWEECKHEGIGQPGCTVCDPYPWGYRTEWLSRALEAVTRERDMVENLLEAAKRELDELRHAQSVVTFSTASGEARDRLWLDALGVLDIEPPVSPAVVKQIKAQLERAEVARLREALEALPHLVRYQPHSPDCGVNGREERAASPFGGPDDIVRGPALPCDCWRARFFAHLDAALAESES